VGCVPTPVLQAAAAQEAAALPADPFGTAAGGGSSRASPSGVAARAWPGGGRAASPREAAGACGLSALLEGLGLSDARAVVGVDELAAGTAAADGAAAGEAAVGGGVPVAGLMVDVGSWGGASAQGPLLQVGAEARH
jgi:hypothetical protein